MYEYTNSLVEKWSKLAFNKLTIALPFGNNFLPPTLIYYRYFTTNDGNAVFDGAFEPYTIW